MCLKKTNKKKERKKNHWKHQLFQRIFIKKKKVLKAYTPPPPLSPTRALCPHRAGTPVAGAKQEAWLRLSVPASVALEQAGVPVVVGASAVRMVLPVSAAVVGVGVGG